MDKSMITQAAILLLWTAGGCLASQPDCAKPCQIPEITCSKDKDNVKPCPADEILKQLNKKTLDLKAYTAQVEYKFIQPLFESEALRKGILYYQKLDKRSKLRINFQTLKQDDEKEQKYAEHYIFDGVWLVHLNFQTKVPRKYQVSEPNKPVNAFAAAGKNLPIIGFTRIEDLKKQFDVKLVEQKNGKPENFIQLHLKVKPNSTYKDDYISIDFWIDKKLYLPAKIRAVSTEEDIYEIKLLKPKVNKKINKKTFDFKIPKDFSELEIVPLKKQGKK